MFCQAKPQERSKVRSIGFNGKGAAYNNRMDEFLKPVTYVGSKIIADEEFYAFELDSDCTNTAEKVYKLYITDGVELFVNNFKNNTCRFYKPTFDIVKT